MTESGIVQAVFFSSVIVLFGVFAWMAGLQGWPRNEPLLPDAHATLYRRFAKRAVIAAEHEIPSF